MDKGKSEMSEFGSISGLDFRTPSLRSLPVPTLFDASIQLRRDASEAEARYLLRVLSAKLYNDGYEKCYQTIFPVIEVMKLPKWIFPPETSIQAETANTRRAGLTW